MKQVMKSRILNLSAIKKGSLKIYLHLASILCAMVHFTTKHPFPLKPLKSHAFWGAAILLFLSNYSLSAQTIDAYSMFEAESLTAQNGLTVYSSGFGNFDNGDWAQYNNVNFGSGASSVGIAIGELVLSGAKLELRLDSPTGKLIGTLTPVLTGAWITYTEQKTPITGATGIHNLFLVGNGNAVGNLDWIKFYQTAPPAPSTLTSTAISATTIDLAWTDNSSNEAGFSIERKTDGGAFTQIATVAANSTAFRNEGTLPATNYTYRVSAYNNAGNSATSNLTSAVTSAGSGISPTSTVPQYNGNISAIQWKTSGGTDGQASNLKEYDFYYDALNRISGSQYQNLNNSGYNFAYNEENIAYDLNGNIKTLSRNGLKNEATLQIDNLVYAYDNGNQLSTVTDNGDKALGFMDQNTFGTDYSYDDNGNMIQDKNKGITIEYNFLNLPRKIFNAGDSIVYTYDASGTKTRKKVYQNSILTATIDYADGSEFYNGTLKYIHTEEGLVEYDATKSVYTYEYFLKDHLGNTRALVMADGSATTNVIQVTDYYPFGMIQDDRTELSSGNKYLYNGKELQDEKLGVVALNLLDYGARFYDPQIGRWTTPDPKSEVNRRWSPYRYAYDNPLRFLDPDGMLEGDFFTKYGKNIGNDGKTDDNVFIVTDKKEVKTIQATDKAGGTTQASNVKSAVATTKTELKEALNVLDRTTKNGGFKEETSVVTPQGNVVQGQTGSATTQTTSNGTVVLTNQLPSVPGNNNTSIHSHQTGVNVTPAGDIESSTATAPGPADPSTFSGYNRNIIVGPLGLASGQKQLNGTISVSQPGNGAVIYDRNSTPLVDLTARAMEKIIK